MGDPTRREIVALLRQGDITAGEIAARFDVSAPSISHHLRILREAGIITDRRQGQRIIYSLDSTVFQDLLVWLRSIAEGGKELD